MKTKMVSYTLETLPPLPKAQLARLKALANRPDSEIDTSGAPGLTDEQWKHAVRGRFYRPVKRQITARVDADVLAWLKGLLVACQCNSAAGDAGVVEVGQGSGIGSASALSGECLTCGGPVALPSQQARDGDVFVERLPMQTAAADANVLALFSCCAKKAGNQASGTPITRPSARFTHMLSASKWTLVALVEEFIPGPFDD